MNPTPLDPAAPFPAQRYRLEYTVERPLHLPEYAGSALRGLFGRALRHASCVTRAPACGGCPLLRSCPYPAIFDTPPPPDARRTYTQVSHPYVVEPPPWGERVHEAGAPFAFHLVLLGPALAQLPLVLAAWQRALAARVGPADGAARFERLLVAAGASVVAGADGEVRAHAQALPPAPPAPAAPAAPITLEFTTPLRLTRDGRALGAARIGAAELLSALLRRIAALSEMQLHRPLAVDYAALTAAARRIESDRALHWRDWTRRSARQQQAMTVGGAVGRIALRGDAADLAAWWPLLHLGQWLHVGKLASFGLGGYCLNATPGCTPGTTP